MRLFSTLISLGLACAASARSLRPASNETEHRQLAPGPTQCFDKGALDWTSQPEKGGILLNGKQFQVKGIR